jgi:hypothetical protein
MKKIFLHWILPLPLGIFTYAIARLFILFGAACNSMGPASRINDPELNSLYLDMWKNGGLSAGYLSGTWWIFLTEGFSAWLGSKVAFGLIPKYRKQILIGVCILYITYILNLLMRTPSDLETSFRFWYTIFCYSVFPLGGIIVGFMSAKNTIQSEQAAPSNR